MKVDHEVQSFGTNSLATTCATAYCYKGCAVIFKLAYLGRLLHTASWGVAGGAGAGISLLLLGMDEL